MLYLVSFKPPKEPLMVLPYSSIVYKTTKLSTEATGEIVFE